MKPRGIILINPIEESGKSKRKKVKKTNYDHKHIINQLVKTISVTKMEQGLKKILYMRIWGEDKSVFSPMNHFQIALFTGLSEYQVRSLEQEALHYVKEHIKNTSLQDSINEFNADRALRNRILEK